MCVWCACTIYPDTACICWARRCAAQKGGGWRCAAPPPPKHCSVWARRKCRVACSARKYCLVPSQRSTVSQARSEVAVAQLVTLSLHSRSTATHGSTGLRDPPPPQPARYCRAAAARWPCRLQRTEVLSRVLAATAPGGSQRGGRGAAGDSLVTLSFYGDARKYCAGIPTPPSQRSTAPW